MAAPNIASLVTITGITTFVGIGTSFSSILSNASSSNQVYKINSIVIANVNGSNNVDVSLGINNQAAGAGSTTYIARLISVPSRSTLVVSGKDTPIYLEENRSITAVASTSSYADCIISYDRIS